MPRSEFLLTKLPTVFSSPTSTQVSGGYLSQSYLLQRQVITLPQHYRRIERARGNRFQAPHYTRISNSITAIPGGYRVNYFKELPPFNPIASSVANPGVYPNRDFTHRFVMNSSFNPAVSPAEGYAGRAVAYYPTVVGKWQVKLRSSPFVSAVHTVLAPTPPVRLRGAVVTQVPAASTLPTPAVWQRSGSTQAAAAAPTRLPRAAAAPTTVTDQQPATLFSHKAWHAIRHQVNFEQFNRLLKRLEQHHQNCPGDQVEQRLRRLQQQMVQDPRLCRALLDEAQIGGESCSDLAIHTLNQLETRCTIEQALQGTCTNDQKMLTIMRSLFRQEQLYQFSQRKVKQLEEQYSPPQRQYSVDPLEVHLGYHIKLKERLQLLGDTREMTFHRLSRVSNREAEEVGNKILSLEKLDRQGLLNFIDGNEHWKRYLTQRYQTAHDQDATITQYADRLEQLETAVEQQAISDSDYLQRANQLMRERQAASEGWYRNKTNELIGHYLG